MRINHEAGPRAAFYVVEFAVVDRMRDRLLEAGLEAMANCAVATGLLAVVAVIHFIITIVLTALVILVCCFCKQTSRKISVCSHNQTPTREQTKLKEGSVDSNLSTEHEYSRGNGSNAHHRRTGHIIPPQNISRRSLGLEQAEPENLKMEFSNSLALPQPPLDVITQESVTFDNPGVVLDNWDHEEPDKMRNKTIEDLRRESLTKKPTSPFRRVSSPLTRSGRFSIASITSKISKKSVDMGTEMVGLMSPGVTSPLDELPHSLGGTGVPSTEDESRTKLSTDDVEDCDHVVLQVPTTDDEAATPAVETTPTILILSTTPEHKEESDC